MPFHTPLSPEQQRALGITSPQPLAMADRVRFAELDPLNHVNNKAYMEWFETSRVIYWDSFCAGFFENDQPPRVVLRNASVHYIREMVLGESYITTARVSAMRKTSYSMEQQLWSGGILRCRMECVMVMLTPDGTERMALPDGLRAQFETIDGAVSEA
ncbi:acyl-CoA thioesterase [Primorskyibacter sp. S87]|uniref:acyl-CoA thioesterase n=1 Tax=Primorskyibacter sp. S87 TaxID=3415126 RepID=UPI003C7D296B